MHLTYYELCRYTQIEDMKNIKWALEHYWNDPKGYNNRHQNSKWKRFVWPPRKQIDLENFVQNALDRLDEIHSYSNRSTDYPNADIVSTQNAPF